MGYMVNYCLLWALESSGVLMNECSVWVTVSYIAPWTHVNLEHHIQNAFLMCRHLVTVFLGMEKAYETAWWWGVLRTFHGWNLNFGYRGLFCFLQNYHLISLICLYILYQNGNEVPQGMVFKCEHVFNFSQWVHLSEPCCMLVTLLPTVVTWTWFCKLLYIISHTGLCRTDFPSLQLWSKVYTLHRCKVYVVPLMFSSTAVLFCLLQLSSF
jgi:hypothetical protein